MTMTDCVYSPRHPKQTKNGALTLTNITTTPLCCIFQPVDLDASAHYHVENPQYCSAAKSNGYLPHTISTGTADTSTSSPSIHSSASHDIEQDICPVTGVYANIHDDYHISSSVLGKGQYGTVRECIHRETRQALAVKSIAKSKLGRSDHLQREIYLLASIDHHSIMKMVDCYEDADHVHIVTEKCTGGELFDKIVKNASPRGCMSERKAAGIIKSLLEAVAYLHENGIVHRDIKPENILLESNHDDAAIKLVDFGLSRRHKQGDAPMSNLVGTAYYMSPELLNGRYDNSCDIWSVGVVAYILLCGYAPFNGNSDAEINAATRNNNGRVQFAGQEWMNKSIDASNFITCLLRRNPRKRLTAKEALRHPWIRKNTVREAAV